MATTAQQPARSRRTYTIALAVLACTSLAGLSYPAANLYLRAASLLLRIENAHSTAPLARYGTHPISVTELSVATAKGPAPARLYAPSDVPNPPGMVVVHGVHHLGIEEPRLVNFARALATSGVAVLTPELASLADYHFAPADVEVIGFAAQGLRQRVGNRVGVLGLSFSGGLSLLAASDSRFADDIGFVAAVGAHDDLQRVCRFLATDQIVGPDGDSPGLTAHEYGALVLVYSHVEDFFSPADVPAARDALRLQLWEKVDEARSAAARLSPSGQQKVKLLLEHRKDALAPEILTKMPLHTSEMASVSPHLHLAGLRAHVILLHGAGDSVIPPTETEWLAREVPRDRLREVLISPLITHVEVGGAPGLRDELALTNWMAAMLREADLLRPHK